MTPPIGGMSGEGNDDEEDSATIGGDDAPEDSEFESVPENEDDEGMFDDLNVESPTVADVQTFVERETTQEMEELSGEHDGYKHGIHLAQSRLGDLSKDLARAELVEEDPTSEVQDETIEEALTGKAANLLLSVFAIAADYDLDIADAIGYRMELTRAMRNGDKEVLLELLDGVEMAEQGAVKPGEDVSERDLAAADDATFQ